MADAGCGHKLRGPGRIQPSADDEPRGGVDDLRSGSSSGGER